MKNCKNCGAPIDMSQNSCPYCDTPYEWITGTTQKQIEVFAAFDFSVNGGGGGVGYIGGNGGCSGQRCTKCGSHKAVGSNVYDLKNT